MPGNVNPVKDEREGLLAFLAQQRYVLRLAAHGLTDEQARVKPTASSLSVGGLIKHVAATERSWMDTLLQRPVWKIAAHERARHAAPHGLADDEHLVDAHVERIGAGPQVDAHAVADRDEIDTRAIDDLCDVTVPCDHADDLAAVALHSL